MKINYNSYRSPSYNSRVRYLILHYTACNFEKSIADLTAKNVSSHYLVPDPTDSTYITAGFQEVVVFNLVDEFQRAWHAGVSSWGPHNNLNDSSIGIENVNVPIDDGKGGWYFPKYNAEQIAILIKLIINILERHPDIEPKRVLGHSDIAYTRKIDPGPCFPWYELFLHGIGSWPDSETKCFYIERFTKAGLPDKSDIIQQFIKYGYSLKQGVSAPDFTSLVCAFQMHFRQDCYDGIMDTETCSILYALNNRYSST